MAIKLTEYDPTWPVAADDARLQIMTTLPGLFHAIEHIGGTAVPGLPARPVIDLMASVDHLEAVTERDSTFAGLGYQRVDTGKPGRLLYQRNDAHLHVVTADTWATRNERLLRDHLRDYPKAAAEYAALKFRLADDDLAYTLAKTELIQILIDRERTFRNLPLVSVRDA